MKVSKLKSGLIYQHNKWLLISAVLICLAGLALSGLSSVAAQEQSKQADQDHNKPPEKTARETDGKVTSPADPNTSEPDAEDGNEDDIFKLDMSSLVSINKSYSRIFTPDLISEEGRVDYKTLKRKRFDVIDAERELKSLNPAVLMMLRPKERIAFWINTYNFCTIKLILDNYPIEPKWYMITYPDNSIMQITGAWKKVFFKINELEYTLYEIEQDFLLKRYKDPRICFALSNASMGGAILRNEPYQAEKLEEQLNDQVKRYLDKDKGMRLDKEENILHLSNLFQMHRNLFLASEYAAIKKFRDRKDHERTWLNFILPHMTEEDVRYLETNEPSIKLINFDWDLNEAK